MFHRFHRLAPALSCVTLVSAAVLADTGLRAESPKSLVTTNFQDETRRLPPDNTVLFSAASRSVSIQLDALDQLDSSELAGTMLTVIDAQGLSREFAADASGNVRIDNVQPGPHAVVASNENAHGSTMLVFKEDGANTARLNETAAAAPQQVGEGRMTLVQVNAQQLLPIVDRFLPPSTGARVPFNTADLVSASVFGPSAFEVGVADDSVMQGQVISLVRGGTAGSSIRGTTLTLFRDGRPVGRAVADSSGRFAITPISPGTYGIIAAGPAGYAAFGFDVGRVRGVVTHSPARSQAAETQFVSTLAAPPAGGHVLPVVLIPPAYTDEVVESIRSYYVPGVPGGPMAGGGIGPFGEFAPVPGAGGFGGGGFGGGFAPGGGLGGGGGALGGGGGALGGGGLGGLGALAGLGAIGAVAASRDDDDRGPILPPQAASRVFPRLPPQARDVFDNDD